MDTKIQIYGVKEALKELKSIDPELRKDINREAKSLAEPVTKSAKQSYPTKYLSGMQRKWVSRGRQLFPYDQNKARKGVVLKIDTGKRNEGTIVIIQKDPAAAIVDMAGKAGGSNARGGMFINNLSAYGQPSRVMWPAYEHNAAAVEKGFSELVEKLMETVGRNVVGA